MGVVATPGGSSTTNTALGAGPYPCLSSLLIGDLIYIDAGVVKKVDRLDISKMPAVGVVTSKPGVTIALIQFFGVVQLYTGLVTGADYFVGANGRPTNDIDIAPSSTVFAQSIGFALDSTTLFLKPDSNMKRMK